ncbi:MAG: hypothetical protein CVV13_09355 [Gammaproteobacteria bacterium HGW-Gammaproteobacteria-3]|nr:MAG: hypothetical protein CVV13_09355 [Gammaproteobacteria bacterium HGW-Gammaproteobacteria-3]
MSSTVLPTPVKCYIFRFFRLLLFTVMAGNMANAAEIVVSVDRNPVGLNESFLMTFSASESPDDDPDFSPLERNFEILNQSQSTSTSLINGKYSKRQQWQLNVMARRAGDLVIPAIAFGDDKSQALALRVTQESPNPSFQSNDALFLEVEASPENPYVQAQVRYTLRFYRRVDTTQASLSEPEMADAVIEKLGDDINFNTPVNGVNYAVTERNYAIFPQKSGTRTIPPLTLNAQVIVPGNPRFNGFFNRQSTHMQRVVSKAVTLKVQKVPEAVNGRHWLPAEGLSLSQEWSGDIGQMKVGEPLTRTLTLVAKGATVGQLPELGKTPVQQQLSIYPDQPVLKEEKKTEGLIAFRQEKMAFIPVKAGRYNLPAIEVPWFNTRTGQMELAKIPPLTLVAVPSGGANPVLTQATAAVEPSSAMAAPLQPPAQANNYWMWLALVLGVGWLITLFYFLSRAKTKSSAKIFEDPVEVSLKDCTQALKKACFDNNARAAKEALIVWGSLTFKVSSLGALAPMCDARLSDEIKRLNQYLYGRQNESWQGRRLFQAFVENKARAQLKTEEDKSLEPLYRL